MKKSAIILLMSTSLAGSHARALDGSAAAMTAAGVAAMAATHSGVFAAAGTPKCAHGNLAMCAMVGLSLGQVVLSLFNKKNSDQSAKDLATNYTGQTDAGGNGINGTDVTGNGNGNSDVVTGLGLDPKQDLTSPGNTAKVVDALNSNGLGGLASDYQKSASTVEGSGVKTSADGTSVTLPNGKTADGSAFGSAQSMVDSGFSPADSAAASDFLASQNKNGGSASKVAALSADGSGGGHSAAAGGGGGLGGGGDDGSLAAKMRAAALANKGKGVSGMSKKFGGDNIGVSGDDIWEMISRRYKARDNASAFIKN